MRGCFCCGDERLVYENGPYSVCEDCSTAGCNGDGCKVDLRFPPRHYRSGELVDGRCPNVDCNCRAMGQGRVNDSEWSPDLKRAMT